MTNLQNLNLIALTTPQGLLHIFKYCFSILRIKLVKTDGYVIENAESNTAIYVNNLLH